MNKMEDTEVLNNKRSLWNIANDGSVVTSTGYNYYREESKPNSLWEHKILTLALIISCCIVDLIMFKELFGQYSYDSPGEQCMETIGMLVAFDVIPIFIGIQLKKKQQGYPTRLMYLVLAAAIVISAVAVNFYLRFNIENITEDYSKGGQEYSQEVEISEYSDPMNASNTSAITFFNSMLPVITTCGTLFFSMMSSNPRKEEYLKVLKEKCQLEDDIERYETNLKECEIESSLKEDMDREEDERYECQKGRIYEKERELKSYVRDQLKLLVNDAASISELSKADIPTNITYIGKETA